MTMNRALSRLAAPPLAAAAVLVPAAPAVAAAPSNDDRAAARTVAVPSETTGSTLGSTLETDEPGGCISAKGSVWYRFTTASAGRIAVRLQANGDLDASVSVFKVNRSQAQPVDCDDTDDSGRAAVSFKSEAGASYLVRVGQRFNSVAGTFT